MLLFGFLQWWYLRGWMDFARGIADKIRNSADFFSIGLLLRTLFYPFRQISAYSDENASLQAQLQAFFDKLLSRTIGAVVRIGILIFGLIAIILEGVIGIVLMILWPLAPLMPIVAVILAVTGVTL